MSIKQEIDNYLKGLTKTRLIGLIHSLAEEFPRMGQSLADRTRHTDGGARSLVIIMICGFFVGMVLSLQAINALEQFGASDQVSLLVGKSLFRELGPVLTALLFAGRAGTSVTASDVVIATGGYTSPLVPALHKSFLPIATYVMLTQANPELISTAVKTTSAILDDRRASDYYRVVDDGRRLLWGGRITTRTAEPRSLACLLHKSMSATYPQLNELQVDYAWSGLMSYARHQMPQIGRLANGMWHCTAFGGHGMNTTAIGGRVIAVGITGHSDRYQRFAPFGLAPTFGALGRAAVQGAYWRCQLADWWRERD